MEEKCEVVVVGINVKNEERIRWNENELWKQDLRKHFELGIIVKFV